MLKLYYAPGASSLAAHVVAEEIGLPFEPVRVDLKGGEQRGPAFLALSPKGRVPVLEHDGFVLTECPAILRHLAGLSPEAGLWPGSRADEARCLEWLFWGASTLHVAYAHIRRPERYAHDEAARAEVVARGFDACRALWPQVEARLAAGGEWAAGASPSVADAYLLVFWNWGRAEALRYDMAAEFPCWTALMRRLAERPAVRRALAREGIAPVA